MLAGLQNTHDVGGADDGADWNNSATQRFAEDDHVGHDFFVLTLQRRSGATKPGLNLIRNHQHVVLLRQSPDRFQVTLRWGNDSCFTLNRLQQHRDSV